MTDMGISSGTAGSRRFRFPVLAGKASDGHARTTTALCTWRGAEPISNGRL
jgi:hypothetical protein